MALNNQWSLIFDQTADRQFSKLEKSVQIRILHFFERVIKSQNPKETALQMTGNRKSFYRYRIGDYRVICRIEERELVIVAVKIGHRKEIYQ